MLVNTDRSDGGVDRALHQAIRYRADASIILSGLPDKSITQLCLRNGQRLVLINRDDDQPGPLRINLDDHEAAGRVVTAFVRAGCTRLAFANSEAGTPSLMARETGFIAAAKAHGLDVIVERHGWTGYEAGKVVAQRVLTRKERPDAVFCATDLLACGFMDAARHQFSLSIPDQLCIVGFDDIEQASWTSYHLTTFAQPVDTIAREAVTWLVDGRKDAPDGQSLKLHADLVWRGSVREDEPCLWIQGVLLPRGMTKPHNRCHGNQCLGRRAEHIWGNWRARPRSFQRANDRAICRALLSETAFRR